MTAVCLMCGQQGGQLCADWRDCDVNPPGGKWRVPQPDGPPALATCYQDIRRAEPGSLLFYELIREAKRLAREGAFGGPR
jgi:hypothetical protein